MLVDTADDNAAKSGDLIAKVDTEKGKNTDAVSKLHPLKTWIQHPRYTI